MAVSGSILTILVFFIGIVSLLGLVVGSGIVAPQVQSLTINTNPNAQVGYGNTQASGLQSSSGTNCIGQSPTLCTGSYSCVTTTSGTCTAVSNQGTPTGCTTFNTNPVSGLSLNGLISSVSSVPTLILAGFQNMALFLSGQQTIAPNPTQCNGVGTISGLVGTIGAVASGQNGNPYTAKPTSISGLVVGTITIAVIFVGLGLLAGVLGAGMLANVIGSSGIGISLIFFMQSVLSSQYFIGIPFILSIFVEGITGAFFIWIIIVMLK